MMRGPLAVGCPLTTPVRHAEGRDVMDHPSSCGALRRWPGSGGRPPAMRLRSWRSPASRWISPATAPSMMPFGPMMIVIVCSFRSRFPGAVIDGRPRSPERAGKSPRVAQACAAARAIRAEKEDSMVPTAGNCVPQSWVGAHRVERSCVIREHDRNLMARRQHPSRRKREYLVEQPEQAGSAGGGEALHDRFHDGGGNAIAQHLDPVASAANGSERVIAVEAHRT